MGSAVPCLPGTTVLARQIPKDADFHLNTTTFSAFIPQVGGPAPLPPRAGFAPGEAVSPQKGGLCRCPCALPAPAQLEKLYPDMPMKLRLSAPSAPFLNIGPEGLTLRPVVDIQAYAILPSSTLAPLFLLSLVSLGTGDRGPAKAAPCKLAPGRAGSRCVLAGRGRSPGARFGARWGERCRSSALSPQTGNVSAVVDVDSGRIVGSLQVGRYEGERAGLRVPHALSAAGAGWGAAGGCFSSGPQGRVRWGGPRDVEPAWRG